jgi:hypothetical protein
MIAKLKAFCRHSLTVAWSYVLGALGVVSVALPVVADLLGDPTVSAAVSGVLPSKAQGAYVIGAAVITYAARCRSLAKA